MRLRPSFIVLAACLAPFALASLGCGQATGTVSGEVLVDGKPLDKGVISFTPRSDPNKAQSVEVLAGKYSVTIPTGEAQVQFSAPIVTGMVREYNSPDAPMMEERKEILPPRYHSESKEKLQVTSGSNTKNWDLSTKP